MLYSAGNAIVVDVPDPDKHPFLSHRDRRRVMWGLGRLAPQRRTEAMPGVLHTFTSYEAAADEAFVARIYGGIHFRTACQDGHTLGIAVGSYVLANALLPIHGP